MRKVFNFRCRYLVNCQLRGCSGVGLDMLLEHQSIGISLLTDQALVKCPDWSTDLVNTHVCFQVTLGCKPSLTNLAPVRTLACVCSVVHLQSRFAREHFVTNNTLIRIGQLVTQLVNQMLQLTCLSFFVNLNKVLPLFIMIFHLR